MHLDPYARVLVNRAVIPLASEHRPDKQTHMAEPIYLGELNPTKFFHECGMVPRGSGEDWRCPICSRLEEAPRSWPIRKRIAAAFKNFSSVFKYQTG